MNKGIRYTSNYSSKSYLLDYLWNEANDRRFHYKRCNNSFCNKGIITPNSLSLSSSGFSFIVAKVNTKKHKCFFVVSKKFIFLLTFIKIATSKFLWKNLKMQVGNFGFLGVGLSNPATQTNFVCLVC